MAFPHHSTLPSTPFYSQTVCRELDRTAGPLFLGVIRLIVRIEINAVQFRAFALRVFLCEIHIILVQLRKKDKIFQDEMLDLLFQLAEKGNGMYEANACA